MARTLILWALCAALETACFSQARQPQPSPAQQKEQEPPEEDESLKPKNYSFNPLQAEKEMRIGHYYLRKGSYRAAANRFREAPKWDPGQVEAYFRLGEAEEKLKDKKAAKEAYKKYLEVAPDGKDAAAAKKKLAGL